MNKYYNINDVKKIHKQDLHLMHLCIDIAKKSDMRCQHGCIIEDNKGNIISKACNKSNNLPEKHILDNEKRPLFSKHAEETALKNVDKTKLKGAKLYVVRWGGNSDEKMCFMNSKPCNKCTSIIKTCMHKYGLKVAYYSTNNSIFEDMN
jgi:tRNA(Arg) A34 adenosine deaminase TadA